MHIFRYYRCISWSIEISSFRKPNIFVIAFRIQEYWKYRSDLWNLFKIALNFSVPEICTSVSMAHFECSIRSLDNSVLIEVCHCWIACIRKWKKEWKTCFKCHQSSQFNQIERPSSGTKFDLVSNACGEFVKWLFVTMCSFSMDFSFYSHVWAQYLM